MAASTSFRRSTASASEPPTSPTERSRWRALRLLQAAMDADIARVYAEAQISGVKPNFVMELIRLHARGPMTITELAGSVQRTHSATSQKVAAMRAVGLSTEAAIAEIEAEIPYPLSQVATDIEEALRRKSFHDRIVEKLANDPAWS